MQVLILEAEHAAVGVVDDDDLVRAEQLLGDDQRAERAEIGPPAGVADDVRVAIAQPEEVRRVQPGIHAGQDRDLARRRRGQIARVELLGVTGVGFEKRGDFRHKNTSLPPRRYIARRGTRIPHSRPEMKADKPCYRIADWLPEPAQLKWRDSRRFAASTPGRGSRVCRTGPFEPDRGGRAASTQAAPSASAPLLSSRRASRR